MVAGRYNAVYIRVGDSIGCDEFVEIPAEDDGILSLSTLTGQFPDAVGLRFKSPSGDWRGIKCTEGRLDPPPEGWGNGEYITVKHGQKRKLENTGKVGGGGGMTISEKLSRMTEKEILSDLIAINLPYSATEQDVKSHFEQFGKVEMVEIKYDSNKKSRGFGFVRYATVEAVEKALKSTHIIQTREVGLKFPKDLDDDDNPTKVFIGRLPRGCKANDLEKHFAQYGVIKSAYIPEPFRGFGFVTFALQSVAHEVMETTHKVMGNYVNVSWPSMKGDSKNDKQQVEEIENKFNPGSMQGYGNMQQQQQGNNNYNWNNGNMPGGGNISNMYNNMQRMNNNMQRNNGMQGQNMQGNNMHNMQQGNNMQSMLGNKGYTSFGGGGAAGNTSGGGYKTPGYNSGQTSGQTSGKPPTAPGNNYRWGV